MLFQKQAEQRIINDPLEGSADTYFATNATKALKKVEGQKAALIVISVPWSHRF